MKAKRATALLLALAMTLSAFVGCGQKETAETNTDKVESTETAESKAVTFPLEETMEFDVVVCGGNDIVCEFTDTLIYQWMEEHTNVKFNITTLSKSEYDEKTNLLINSGDYPDMFFKASEKVRAYKDQGIFLPLEDYIKDYAPNYSALIDGIANGWNMVTSADGHQYAFYGVGQEYELDTFMIPYAYINTQWLENLGLDMPHDPESFYEVLKAFKEQDADGDGDATNEVPFIMASGNIMPIEVILPYFGFDMEGIFSGWAKSEDGNSIEYFATTERYKEAIAYMTKLYEEGLMHKDSLTLTHDQVESMAQTGTSIGCFFAWDPQYTVGVYDSSLSYDENLVTQYEVMQPWDGAKVTACSVLRNDGAYITDKCENPEVLVAWLDLLYSDETTVLSNYGIEGDTYDLVDGKILMRDKNNPSTTYGDEPERALMAMGGGLFSPSKLYNDNYELYYDTDTNPYVNYVYECAKEFREKGLKYDVWPTYTLTPEESTENADILADADPYRTQYRAEVITGVKDLDATWDEYIETMNKMKIQTAVDNVNAAYERYLSLN